MKRLTITVSAEFTAEEYDEVIGEQTCADIEKAMLNNVAPDGAYKTRCKVVVEDIDERAEAVRRVKKAIVVGDGG